jgi:hypothetical protein
MLAYGLPGLACGIFIIRELKLLVELFIHGSSRVRLGCILSVVIPITIFGLILVVALKDEKRLNEIHAPTKTAIAKTYGSKGIGIYKVGSDIAPGMWIIPDFSCHWLIINEHGKEIRSNDLKFMEITRFYVREWDNKIEIQLMKTDREFQNIDCGQIEYNQAFK